MDAFFASVEQAAKPSLRGKPVIVGGLGPRGVVATASYEARIFGVHSAMPMAHARRRCPNAAFLVPRFRLYREISESVMRVLGQLSPLVEPLSLDEAFVDLAAGPYGELLDGQPPEASAALARALAEDLRSDIHTYTGLAASVGLATSKLLGKIASEQAKPDGLVVIPAGLERDTLAPMSVRALPGVGPATGEALRGSALRTVADVADTGEDTLVRILGQVHGRDLHTMAHGWDDRPVVAERDAKSVSVEDTFDVDVADQSRIGMEIDRLAQRCVERLHAAGRTGRTVVLKIRLYDFSTLTRSETLGGPTDDLAVVRRTAHRLAAQVDVAGGVRLLGVGISGLADYAQDDLFSLLEEDDASPGDVSQQLARTGLAATDPAVSSEAAAERPQHPEKPALPEQPEQAALPRLQEGGDDAAAHGGIGAPHAFHPGRAGAQAPRWLPGQDIWHAELGPGWVQGSGLGRVTVRFERPDSGIGRVRTFSVDDPALTASDPLPLIVESPHTRS